MKFSRSSLISYMFSATTLGDQIMAVPAGLNNNYIRCKLYMKISNFLLFFISILFFSINLHAMNSERSPLLEDREVIHRAPSRITHDSITLRGQHSYEHATHIEIDCCFGNNPTSPEKLESVLVPKHCKFIQKPRWARTERNERGGGWLTKEYDVEESDNTDSAGKHCYGLEDMETKPPTRVNPHASWCPEYVGLLERGLNKLTCNRFTEKFRSPRWRACAITSTGVVAFILSGIICSQACTEE